MLRFLGTAYWFLCENATESKGLFFLVCRNAACGVQKGKENSRGQEFLREANRGS